MSKFRLRMLIDVFLDWNPSTIFDANFLAKTANGQKTSQCFDLPSEGSPLNFTVNQENN